MNTSVSVPTLDEDSRFLWAGSGERDLFGVGGPSFLEDGADKLSEGLWLRIRVNDADAGLGLLLPQPHADFLIYK